MKPARALAVSGEEIEVLRARYVGKPIRVEHCFGDPVPWGSVGYVSRVDALGTIYVTLINGRTIELLPGIDWFEPAPPPLASERRKTP